MSHRSWNSWRQIAALLLMIAGVLSGARESAADDELEFRPRTVIAPRRAITTPPVIEAADVTDEVHGNELVLGVVVDGEARAYPINMLTGPSREIINDTLRGAAIAATW